MNALSLLCTQADSLVNADLRIFVFQRDDEVLLTHLFTGEDEVKRIAGLGVRTVQEHVAIRRIPIDEADRFEGHLQGVEFCAPKQQIYVLVKRTAD